MGHILGELNQRVYVINSGSIHIYKIEEGQLSLIRILTTTVYDYEYFKVISDETLVAMREYNPAEILFFSLDSGEIVWKVEIPRLLRENEQDDYVGEVGEDYEFGQLDGGITLNDGRVAIYLNVWNDDIEDRIPDEIIIFC